MWCDVNQIKFSTNYLQFLHYAHKSVHPTPHSLSASAAVHHHLRSDSWALHTHICAPAGGHLLCMVSTVMLCILKVQCDVYANYACYVDVRHTTTE